MVYSLHRDGGVGDGVSLQITNKALNATMDLTKRHKDELRFKKSAEDLYVTMSSYYINQILIYFTP